MHIWLVPFNTPEKNLLQFVGLSMSALIAFAGLVLNYLNVSLDKAKLAGQLFKARRLMWQIDAVKLALSAITIGGFVVVGIIQAVKFYRKRGKIANTLASGARKVRRMTRIKNRSSAGPGATPTSDVELQDLQQLPAVPVPSLELIEDIDRSDGRLARLSMDAASRSSEAVSAGGAGAAITQGGGEQAALPGGGVNGFCFENPLNEEHAQTASVESKIVDSGLGDVDGSLAARPKSERFELMRRFNREKDGDEAVPVAMRPRNDSTSL